MNINIIKHTDPPTKTYADSLYIEYSNVTGKNHLLSTKFNLYKNISLINKKTTMLNALSPSECSR